MECFIPDRKISFHKVVSRMEGVEDEKLDSSHSSALVPLISESHRVPDCPCVCVLRENSVCSSGRRAEHEDCAGAQGRGCLWWQLGHLRWHQEIWRCRRRLKPCSVKCHHTRVLKHSVQHKMSQELPNVVANVSPNINCLPPLKFRAKTQIPKDLVISEINDATNY